MALVILPLSRTRIARVYDFVDLGLATDIVRPLRTLLLASGIPLAGIDALRDLGKRAQRGHSRRRTGALVQLARDGVSGAIGGL